MFTDKSAQQLKINRWYKILNQDAEQLTSIVKKYDYIRLTQKDNIVLELIPVGEKEIQEIFEDENEIQPILSLLDLNESKAWNLF